MVCSPRSTNHLGVEEVCVICHSTQSLSRKTTFTKKTLRHSHARKLELTKIRHDVFQCIDSRCSCSRVLTHNFAISLGAREKPQPKVFQLRVPQKKSAINLMTFLMNKNMTAILIKKPWRNGMRNMKVICYIFLKYSIH